MPVKLTDAYTGFGGLGNAKREHLPLDEMLAYMEELDIARALVRTVPDDMEREWLSANQILYDICAEHDGLVPCPVLIPPTARDYPPEDAQVDRALAGGAGAVRLRPKTDNWPIREWVCGPLLRALQEKRLPAFLHERDLPLADVPFGGAHSGFPLAAVGDLAGAYPDLPIILAGFDYRVMRTLLPLLRTFRNVHTATGYNFAMHRGLEFLVRELGPDQILFGTGFPVAEPAMYVTQLMYADIPDDARAAIGSGNLERLLEGIVR
ncbi:MAG: amidohydrolase family protein [Planctomycetota bacterium]